MQLRFRMLEKSLTWTLTYILRGRTLGAGLLGGRAGSMDERGIATR